MTKTLRNLLADIRDRVLGGMPVDYTTASSLSSVSGADLWDLISAANRVRDKHRGPMVDICSIVNAKSGACSEDCAYCAQSVHHSTSAAVYPLVSADRIAEAAASAKANGASRFCIVTSGRGIESHDDLETIAKGVERVRSMGLSPCATLGTLDCEQLAYLKKAGLDRYHHNIETSRDYFPRICTTHTFDERLEVLRNIHRLNLSACSGGIFGMGETMEDRLKMAFTLRELDVDSVPINFLMPIQGTPLEYAAPLPPLEALHTIALFRFILPDKEIRICGGRWRALGQFHPLIFAAGADGFMIGNYLTQSGLDPSEDLRIIRDLGLTVR